MTDTEMRPEVFRERLEHELSVERPLPSVTSYEAAGRRLLRRRRSALAVGSVVVAVTLPVAVTTLSATLHRQDEAPTVSEPSIPDDWRTEAGRGVTFSVPTNWESGDMSQWCTRGDPSPPPLVHVAGHGVSTAVACHSPEYWYGVTLAPADLAGPALPDQVTQYWPPDGSTRNELPAGSWGARVDVGDGWALTVVAPTEEAAVLILSSLEAR